MKRSIVTRSLTAGFMFFMITMPGLAHGTYAEPGVVSGYTVNPPQRRLKILFSASVPGLIRESSPMNRG